MKNRFLILLVFFSNGFAASKSAAQLKTGFSILYRYEDSYMPFTVNGQYLKLKEQYGKLVFTDSVSFFCFFRGKKDPYRKDSVYRRTPLHHSIYYSSTLKWLYHVVAIVNHENRKPGYLLADSVQHIQWELRNDQKLIAGFRCEAALGIKQGTDTLMAWFTRDIPGSFAPANYTGLPGVVLDLTDMKSGQHLTAIRVEEKPLLVVFPEKARLIYNREEIR